MMSARNPQRILGCPICGYRVDTAKDRTCPRCGSEFETGTRFECPLCGGLVDANAKACPSCHVDYGDFRERTLARGSDDDIDELLNEIIGIESSQVKQAGKKYSCPKCSWMLDGTEAVCPRCNHDLVTDLSFQCPMCGAIVRSSAKACPECGVSFDESEAAEERPESPPSKVQPTPTVVEEPEEHAPVQAPSPQPVQEPQPEPERMPRPTVVVKPPRTVARPIAKPEPGPVVKEIPAEKAPQPQPAPSVEEPGTEAEEIARPEPAKPAPAPVEESPQPAAKSAGVKRRKLKPKP